MTYIINKLRRLFSVGGTVPKLPDHVTSSTLTLKELTRNAVTNIVVANVALAEIIFRLKSDKILPSDVTYFIKPRMCDPSAIGYCVVDIKTSKCFYCGSENERSY